MKIRTITLGISEIPTSELIRWAGRQLERAVDHFSSQGYSVQTRRLALNRWDVGIGLMPQSERKNLLQMVDSLCAELGIDFCSVGIANNPEQIKHMAHLLAEYPRLSACADVGCEQHGLNDSAIHAAAEAIRYLGSHSDKGFGNFQFGAGFCLKADSAFFPGAYHQSDQPSFTIGLENSDLLVEAFSKAERLETARERLFDLLSSKYGLVEKSALTLAEILNVPFGGVDTSIAPSLHPNESIVRAFRSVNIEFGKHGTLAACGIVTDVLKSLPVKRIGYCGIMLPVLEDAGLAEAAEEEQFGITDLLAYSSVCGVGVDMVPIPGDVSLNQIEALMLDVGVMALKLKKPLSVRILPIPGKRAGELTQFESPYICNSRVMTL
jgi:uncharacterized protein (UPF0210 family)